ncbi:MAG: hypothetical protein SFV15_21205 [Polyangiaceae bacterium]|nr:hypothetical protein [Polyangiaceae bacterium]
MADPSAEEESKSSTPDASASSPSAPAQPEKPSRPVTAGKAKKRRAELPRTEAELNRPEPQTLLMLGTVCVATLIMWGAARAACNYHPPHESRRARAVTLAELTADPKNAAIEAVQRWATHDFRGAAQVATGAVLRQIEAEEKACLARGAACAAEAQALKASVVTTADLLEAAGQEALVRVYTRGAEPARTLVKVVREGAGWKISQRRPDDGSTNPSEVLGAAGAAAARP